MSDEDDSDELKDSVAKESNVIGIDGSQVRSEGMPNEEVISVAEQILKDAKSGILQNFVAVGFTSRNTVVRYYAACDNNPVETIGAIRVLEAEFLEDVMNAPFEED